MFLWAKIQTLTDRDLRHKINKKYAKVLNTKFGLPYLPIPILTIEYTPFWESRVLKKLCSHVTKKIFKSNIATLLNSALKIIPTKPKSISQILSNTMKKTHQRSFQCAGHPWCTAESHFTKDLKELDGLCSKVGTKNANTVPWKQEGGLTVLTMIGEWLRRLLIYKIGLNGNITKRLNLDTLTDKDRVNIYTDNGEVFSLSKLAVWDLWEEFRSESQSVAKFVKKLISEYQQLKAHEKINKLKMQKHLESKMSEIGTIKEQRNITYFDQTRRKPNTGTRGKQEIIIPFVTGVMWDKRTVTSSNIYLYLMARKLTKEIKAYYKAIFQEETIKNFINKKDKKMKGYWGNISTSGRLACQKREELVVKMYEHFAQFKSNYSIYSEINILKSKLPLNKNLVLYEEVMQVKKLLAGNLTISVKDKNTGQLRDLRL